MTNKIIIKSCEVRNDYFRVTTEKGTVLGDWRGKEPLKVGETYNIEWQYSRDGKYRNIKYADQGEAIKTLEEI